uniref:Uncharacterized protein n=1 Tax=Elaeophora elaphi TaxID=1147741 RepID=A0A0R3S3K8_9BILA
MELPDDVVVELAAAIGYYLRNIRIENVEQLEISQNIEQQPTKNNFTSRTAISDSKGVKRRKKQTNQNGQISSQPAYLTSDNVESRTVVSQSYSQDKRNKTETLTTEGNVPTKIAEWKNKLDHLSFLFNSFSNGTMSAIQICRELDVKFRDLVTFLCYTSSTRRPITVSDPVEVYAGSLVKLHQYCVISSDNLSENFSLVVTNSEYFLCDETVLYGAIYEVISFWLRYLHRENLNKHNPFWLHTRAVITRMFRNIIIQQCILVVKHRLASMLQELIMLSLEHREYSYGFYACEQVEYLMTVLSHQASHISF